MSPLTFTYSAMRYVNPRDDAKHMHTSELLILQVWKSEVLPLLQQHIAERVDSMTTYMILQHEAAIANLLEVQHTPLHPMQCF